MTAADSRWDRYLGMTAAMTQVPVPTATPATQVFHSQSAEIETVPDLQSQIVTAKSIKKQRFLPYAFSEIGVAMLSSVLKSEVAIQANRKIMKAFVAYRHLAELPLAATYLDLRKQIEGLRQEVNDILADQNDK